MGSPRVQFASALLRAASSALSNGAVRSCTSSGLAGLQAAAASAVKQTAGSSSSALRFAAANSRSLHRAPLSALAQSLLAQSSSSQGARFATHAAPVASHEPVVATPPLLSTDGTAAAAASSALEGSGEEEDEENLGPRRKRKRLKHPDKLSPDKDQLEKPNMLDTNTQPELLHLNKQPPQSVGFQGQEGMQAVSTVGSQPLQPQEQEQQQHTEQQGEGAEGAAVYILTAAERLQQPLPSQDSIFLWRRSEEMARLGALQRIRLGKGGPSRAWLSKVGDLLAAHELVRVDVPPENGDVELVKELLEATQDCVTIKVKGRTVTVYRDSSLPRPPASRADMDLEESVRAAALRSPRDPAAALRVNQPGSQEWSYAQQQQQQQVAQSIPSSSRVQEANRMKLQRSAMSSNHDSSSMGVPSSSTTHAHHDPDFMAAWQERKRLLAQQRSSSSSRSRGRAQPTEAADGSTEEDIATDAQHEAYDAGPGIKAGSPASRDTRVARMLALRAALRNKRFASAGAA